MNTAPEYVRFIATLTDTEPPMTIASELVALWWLRRGEWDTAHRIVQDIETPAAALVHAHLHRVEGDIENAAYWYGRAGQPACNLDIEDEWESLVRTLARD